MTLRALYDGWTLSYAPASPAALHLLALLGALNEEIHPCVALPAASVYTLPARAESVLRLHPNTASAQLAWEQRSLPALAIEQHADLLHLTGLHLPLNSRVPLFLSPAETAQNRREAGGLAGRLRAALSAGLADVPATLLWPDDLPAPHKPAVALLPPLAALPPDSRPDHPALEPGYALYHSVGGMPDFRALLAGWAWAAAAVGEFTPLILAGLSPLERAAAVQLAQDGNFGDSVRLAAEIPNWPRLYRDAGLVVRTGVSQPWGDPVTLALAAGKAIVAPEDTAFAARVGPAAYLVPLGDDRALGAALTTLLVETEMAESLGAAAFQRASDWDSASFGARLSEIYQQRLKA